MRLHTYEWKDLSDSRVILEARTNAVISWFLGILILLLGVGIVWSYYSRIDIVVKAQGIVRPNTLISTVSSGVQGKVTYSNLKSGQHVKQGEVLLRIGLENMDDVRNAIQAQFEKSIENVQALTLIENQAQTGKRSFISVDKRGSSGEETDGRNEVRLKWEVAFRQNEYESQQSQYVQESNEQLLNAVSEKHNTFHPTDLNYQKAENYKMKVEQLQAILIQAENTYKSEYRQEGEVERSKDSVVNAQRDLRIYQNQFVLDVSTVINEEKTHLKQLQLERENLLVQLKQELAAERKQTQELKNQLLDIDLQISKRTITAALSGIIKVEQHVSIGDLIQAGSTIASIIPEGDASYTMQLAIDNRDVGSIQPGMRVKYDFLALPAKEYGYLSGVIRVVNPDASQSSDIARSYYLAEATLVGNQLSNRSGKHADVKVGMGAEVQMITKRQRVLSWVLLKLDFMKE